MIRNTQKSDISSIGRVRVCLRLLKDEKLKGKVFVDVGSSFGWLEKKVSKEGAKEIIGIEPNKKALEFAKETVQGVTFLHGSALKLPVKSLSADVVSLFDVIEHTPKGSETKVLTEISRVLKKGGTLLLTTPNSHPISNILDPAWYIGHRHYKLINIVSLLKKSGFSINKAYIRGGFWTCVYLTMFYLDKWMLGSRALKNSWLERKYNGEFDRSGFQTIFIKATKN